MKGVECVVEIGKKGILIVYRVMEAGFFEMLIFEQSLNNDVHEKVVLAEGSASADALVLEPARCTQRTAKRLCGWSRVRGEGGVDEVSTVREMSVRGGDVSWGFHPNWKAELLQF